MKQTMTSRNRIHRKLYRWFLIIVSSRSGQKFILLSIAMLLIRSCILISSYEKTLADRPILISSYEKTLADRPNPDLELQRQCPTYPNDLPASIVEVQLFYHVGMINNWKDIVKDQMDTLLHCGLIHYSASLTISYSNGDENSVKELKNLIQETLLLFENETNIDVNFIPGPGTIPWEAASLNAIYNSCQESLYSTVVFYFHNKGTGSYKTDWKKTLGKSWTYSMSLYWRKYLEYFTLENPYLCLTALANGAYTCGPQITYPSKPKFHPMHYSGNFWSARCDYINESENIIPFDIEYEVEEGVEGFDARKWSEIDRWNEYVSSEFWIGGGYSEEKHEKFIGIYNRDKDFYNYLIRPKEYALDDKRDAEKFILDVMSGAVTSSTIDNILQPLVKKERHETLNKNSKKTQNSMNFKRVFWRKKKYRGLHG